jgi:hypothetical protein
MIIKQKMYQTRIIYEYQNFTQIKIFHVGYRLFIDKKLVGIEYLSQYSPSIKFKILTWEQRNLNNNNYGN